MRERLSGDAEPLVLGVNVGKWIVGRYRVIDYLGSGSMGHVYKVEDIQRDDLQLALKMMRKRNNDNDLVARFRREIAYLQKLQHPNIVSIHDVGIDCDRVPYYTMDYIEGKPFCELIWQPNALSLRQRVEIVAQIADAIDCVHRQGIVHRDLKPENIIVAKEGTPVLIDFGIATTYTEYCALAKADCVLGTPSYMSPEQVLGDLEIDGRSDVFSLGAILYRAITRRCPFRGESLRQTLAAIVEESPKPLKAYNSVATDELEAICRKALAKDKRQRYATAKELRDDLWRYLQGKKIEAILLTDQKKRGWLEYRNYLLFAGIVLFIFLLISFWRAELLR